MTSDGCAGCTHDRRCYALLLLATSASPRRGEATALKSVIYASSTWRSLPPVLGRLPEGHMPVSGSGGNRMQPANCNQLVAIRAYRRLWMPACTEG